MKDETDPRADNPIQRLIPPDKPIWPDDELTQAWLEGIAEYRKQRNSEPDPWDEEAGEESERSPQPSDPV